MAGISKAADSMESRKGRIDHLDSCRGIAACMVVASHSLQSVDMNKSMEPIRIGLGHLPVLFFFLLSGFVLGRSLGKNEASIQEFVKYSIRRIFRLYPALIMVVLIAFVLSHWMTLPLPELLPIAPSIKNNINWMGQVSTIHQLLENVLLIQRGLDIPIWTIKVEIVCSLLLPLIIWVCLNKRWLQLLMLIVLYLYSTPLINILFHNPNNDLNAFESSRYLYLFFAGYLLNLYKNLFHEINGAHTVTIISSSIAVLVMQLYFQRGSDVISAIALCFMLFALIPCRNTTLKKILLHKWLVLVGAMSYSIYLLHAPILCFLISNVLDADFYKHILFIKIIGIFGAVCFLSIAFGYFLFSLIEVPCNSFGHHLSALYGKTFKSKI